MTPEWLVRLWNMHVEHSAVVQAIASSFSVLLLVITILLTQRTVRLTQRAMKFTRRQAEAAENAANLQILQLAQSVGSQDKATQPLLTVEFNKDNTATAKITNVGLGPAFKIIGTLADKPEDILHCLTDVLGAGQHTEIWFSELEVGIFGLRITYESAHERPHECICRIDSASLVFKQEHRAFPCKIDELYNTKFRV